MNYWNFQERLRKQNVPKVLTERATKVYLSPESEQERKEQEEKKYIERMKREGAKA